MTKKYALFRFTKLIEYWADNPKVRSEEVLRKVPDIALAAFPQR